MQNIRLPDGTWVTSAIGIGIGQISMACAAGCHWEDVGPVTEEVPRVQMQQCSDCGRVRGRYLDDPTTVEDV